MKNTGSQQESPKEVKEKKGPPSPPVEASGNEGIEILRELRELRKENQESFAVTKASLSRLEVSVTDLKQRMGKLELRTREAE